MPSDLRTYLNDLGDHLLRIEREVDVATQIGALCAESDRPVHFERVKGHAGWE